MATERRRSTARSFVVATIAITIVTTVTSTNITTTIIVNVGPAHQMPIVLGIDIPIAKGAAFVGRQ